MKLSERMARLGTETAFEVLVRARALEAKGRTSSTSRSASPTSTRPRTSEAGMRRSRAGTHYGPRRGCPSCARRSPRTRRRGAASRPRPRRSWSRPGGKPIMFFPMLALLEPGDEVIYPNPGFPIYESMIRFIGGEPVPMRCSRRRASRSTSTSCRQLTPKTKLMILNSPQNPTGGVIPEADLRAIADAAVQHDDPVLSDEIYSRILYDGKHVSIARCRAWRRSRSARRLLEDLRDDRLAPGLRHHAGAARGGGRQADDELDLLHRELHAARRPRRAQGRPGPSTRWSRSSAAPRRDRRRPAPDPGLPLRAPAGRFYAFPNITGTGTNRRSSPTACWTKRASPACRAPPSASTARATCASATPTPSRTSRRRCAGSRPASRSSASRAAQARPTAFARIQSWPTARWTKFLKKAGEFFS